ncbi:PIN domain-containing protein [Streptacidiphilus jiangxiensis]|uniref:PIN domain-containing protein n=1 Tax=Streptacidiphilus jiangxiensis TaxID=235985 RepID=A0A1H7S737_STRJI|nr:PIN domain-containing protein [Streptacidiphilus jiangxiensis]SEL68109.1 hypothetical protein SAMN05414137_111184 [Streptacidiphilus jiangxiensis]
MAGDPGYLIDVSAVGRMMRPDVVVAWREQVAAGQVGLCQATALQLLGSARTGEEYARMRTGLTTVYTAWSMPPDVFRLAEEYQERLARQGELRLGHPAALLPAATAAHHGLTLLHYDEGLDRLGRLVGLPTRWLAEPGSID